VKTKDIDYLHQFPALAFLTKEYVMENGNGNEHPLYAHGDPAYKLGRFDVDLSVDLKDVESALKEMFATIKTVTGVELKRSDLIVSTTARAYYPSFTLDNQEVEWTCTKEGTFEEIPGKWSFEVSVDDPKHQVSERKLDGPNCPHVGYRFWFKANGGGKNFKATGHILLHSVYAFRPHKSWRDKIEHDRFYDNRFSPERR
jgi:hypothetical protein